MNPLDLAFDHAVILVHDLDQAARRLSEGGFLVSAENRHETFGTANRIVVFENGYLELLAIVDDSRASTPEQQLFRRLLSAGEGHHLTALAPRNAHAAVTAAASLGIPATAPRQWTRQAAGDPPVELGFTTAFLGRGGGHVFFLCAHRWPERLYRPSAQLHPNGARQLVSVDIGAPLDAPAAEVWSALGGAEDLPLRGGVRLRRASGAGPSVLAVRGVGGSAAVDPGGALVLLQS